jgi:hypothetical protein
MKLQSLALGLALVAAGSAAFAATSETTVTRETPHGVVTRHIVRTNEPVVHHYRHVRRVVLVPPHHYHHQYRHVVVVHPAHHGHYASNRTVVIHRNG